MRNFSGMAAISFIFLVLHETTFMKRLCPPLFMLMSFLFCGCHQATEPKPITIPEKGELCFKADSSPEYLQLLIDHGKVEGRLLNLTENEVLVKRFISDIEPGTENSGYRSMNVDVSYADVSESKTWVILPEEDGLMIKFDNDYLHYTMIPNDSMANFYNRLYETILTYKSTGFKLPKGEAVCYRSVSSANGSYLIEFFQLWNTNGKLKGRGAGQIYGELWDFDFHGTMEKNKMNVTVNYRKQGEAPRSVMETWTFDPKDKRIYIKNFPGTVLGAREYVVRDNDDFLTFVHSYFEKEERVR